MTIQSQQDNILYKAVPLSAPVAGTLIQKQEEEVKLQQSKEGGNHLGQGSNRQRTMEGTDGGLHPAVDGQRLGER